MFMLRLPRFWSNIMFGPPYLKCFEPDTHIMVYKPSRIEATQMVKDLQKTAWA